MKAKEIFLLFIIIAAGVFFYHAQTGKFDCNIDWMWDDWILTDSFEFEETRELPPPFPPEIQVANSNGSVEIRGAENHTITISLIKQIWRNNENEAGRIAEELKIITEQGEQRLLISTNRNDIRRRRFSTHLIITVPAGSTVHVKNSYGKVRASDLGKTDIVNPNGEVIASDIASELTIKNSYKDVEVTHVQSSCIIDSKDSNLFVTQVAGPTRIVHKYGSIHLEDLMDDVTVEASNSKIYGENLPGDIEMESSYKRIELVNVGPTKVVGFNAKIEISDCKGDVDIENRYGRVNLKNIEGNLVVNGKNLEIYGNRVTAEKIILSTTYKPVELDDFSGRTTVHNYNGPITLYPRFFSDSIEAKGEYSDITLFWPKDQKRSFEARSKGGKIHWELSEGADTIKENGLTVLKAFSNGDSAPFVLLSTKYGDIKILQ